MQLVRKLTIRTCGFSKSRIMELLFAQKPKDAKDLPDDIVIPLCKIMGTSTGAKSGQSDNGSFVKLLGDFYGVDLSTGELIKSAVCILPNFVSESMAAALLVSPSIKFSLQIDAVSRSNSATGYEFNVTPLVEAEPTDDMKALLKASGVDLKTLRLDAPATMRAEPGSADTGDGDDDDGGEAPAPAPAATKKSKK